MLIEQVLDAYQDQAHTTAVYGGNNVYPVMALTEEISEVIAVWNETQWFWNTNVATRDEKTAIYIGTIQEYQRHVTEFASNAPEFAGKLRDELGDVYWNLAELTTILGLRMSKVYGSYVDPGRKSSVSTNDYLYNVMYQLDRLVEHSGKVAGIYAKWTRKHNGVQPTSEELLSETDIVTYLSCIFNRLGDICKLFKFDVVDVLDRNLSKLAARKSSNTLGGAGSVDRVTMKVPNVLEQ